MPKKNSSSKTQIIPNFVLFTTQMGKVNIEVLFQEDTLWLTQKSIAELFEVDRTVVTKHLKNIFETGELREESVCAKIAHTAQDGKQYNTKHYNLHAVLSVGYRTHSQRAREFRKWANTVLEEFIVKGFAMDDERLKEMKHFGKDYFNEMIERIREIRMSERRIYQKITDIYALSADYDSGADITKHFFASVQNTLHWAITGKTAAETIYSQADAGKENMGLTSWKHAPEGKILKSDVGIAKNYLSEEHIDGLNRIVNSYLDIAETKAKNGKVMNMSDWDTYLKQFLELTDKPILIGKGSISMLEAKLKAESEYGKFRIIQDTEYISDFDREVQKYFESSSKNSH